MAAGGGRASVRWQCHSQVARNRTGRCGVPRGHRSHRGGGWRQVQGRVCERGCLKATFLGEFRVHQDIQDPDIRMDGASVQAAHACQHRVHARLQAGSASAPPVLVEVCLAAYRLLRANRGSERVSLFGDDPPGLGGCVTDIGVDTRVLGWRMHTFVHEAVSAELVELERLSIPRCRRRPGGDAFPARFPRRALRCEPFSAREFVMAVRACLRARPPRARTCRPWGVSSWVVHHCSAWQRHCSMHVRM